MKTNDPLALPEDWRERAGMAFKDIGFKEYVWHATYRLAWAECAARADAQASNLLRILRALVSVKDARIRELEKDNAILKAQMAELEALTERSG